MSFLNSKIIKFQPILGFHGSSIFDTSHFCNIFVIYFESRCETILNMILSCQTFWFCECVQVLQLRGSTFNLRKKKSTVLTDFSVTELLLFHCDIKSYFYLQGKLVKQVKMWLFVLFISSESVFLCQFVWSVSPAVGQIQRADNSPVISCSDTQSRPGSHYKETTVKFFFILFLFTGQWNHSVTRTQNEPHVVWKQLQW